MYYIMRKSYYVMHKLLRYAKNVLRYAVIITLCGNYYVMRRHTRSSGFTVVAVNLDRMQCVVARSFCLVPSSSNALSPEVSV